MIGETILYFESRVLGDEDVVIFLFLYLLFFTYICGIIIRRFVVCFIHNFYYCAEHMDLLRKIFYKFILNLIK